MATARIMKLEIPALLKLRGEIDARLKNLHASLQRQLSFFSGTADTKGARKSVARRAHALKGTKRPAKFRDPATGKTWAGVGMLPLWLKAYEASGKNREQFATGAGAAAKSKKTAKKAGKKRGRKAKSK